jgi:hypothetical protein
VQVQLLTWLCVCVYIYIYIYTHTYIHTYRVVQVHLLPWLCVCVCVYIYIHIHTYIQGRAGTSVTLIVRVCVCVYIYIHIHTYIQGRAGTSVTLGLRRESEDSVVYVRVMREPVRLGERAPHRACRACMYLLHVFKRFLRADYARACAPRWESASRVYLCTYDATKGLLVMVCLRLSSPSELLERRCFWVDSKIKLPAFEFASELLEAMGKIPFNYVCATRQNAIVKRHKTGFPLASEISRSTHKQTALFWSRLRSRQLYHTDNHRPYEVLIWPICVCWFSIHLWQHMCVYICIIYTHPQVQTHTHTP